MYQQFFDVSQSETIMTITTLGFCLTDVITGEQSRLRQIPQMSLREEHLGRLVKDYFHRPEVLPVTQPTLSKN